jgi:hypothetical protein
VVAGILGEIGVIACGIGVFLTLRLYFTILAVTYRDAFKDGAAPAAPQKPPVEPPPAPETPENGESTKQ